MPEGVDYEAIFRLAKLHSMGNLFYEAVKNSSAVPESVKTEAKQHFFANVAQQTAQEYYAEELFERLEEKKIPYVPLKGYILRRMYPAPELRTSCDLDIFYDKECTESVRNILFDMGFAEEREGDNHDAWMLDSVTIETHHDLVSESNIYYDYLKDAFSKLLVGKGMRRNFTPEDFYVYFLIHSAKHFAYAGFGIRTVLDVWIYCKNVSMDEEYLTGELKKVRLLKFREAIESLAEYWFGDSEKTDDLEILSEYVLTSGTYGRSDNRRAIETSGSGAKAARKKFFWGKIFPSFKYMKKMYPIVGKCPILYPFSWIVRWGAVLFKRRRNIGMTITHMKQLDEKKVSKIERVIELTDIPLEE